MVEYEVLLHLVEEKYFREGIGVHAIVQNAPRDILSHRTAQFTMGHVFYSSLCTSCLQKLQPVIKTIFCWPRGATESTQLLC